MEKKYWKSQGILSSRKSGNPVCNTGQVHVENVRDLFAPVVYFKKSSETPKHIYLCIVSCFCLFRSERPYSEVSVSAAG